MTSYIGRRIQGERLHGAGFSPAFTLVEILVVISLISLLIVLLLPALTSAREESLKTRCLANMRQQGIGVAGYAADSQGNIPPNGSRTTGRRAGYGPYITISQTTPSAITRSFFIFAPVAAGTGSARYDLNGDYTWYNGLGLVWANGNIDYTLDGGRVLFCPAEINMGFSGATYTNGPFGPGRFWSGSTPLKDNPFSPTGMNGSQMVYFSYSFRALGGSNGYYSGSSDVGTAVANGNWPQLSNTRTRGRWNLELMAPYVASIDLITDVNNPYVSPWGANVRPRTPHAYLTTYRGFNRLWYDGHAKWLDDPSVMWQPLCDSGGGGPNTGYGNDSTEAMWRLYDTR